MLKMAEPQDRRKPELALGGMSPTYQEYPFGALHEKEINF